MSKHIKECTETTIQLLEFKFTKLAKKHIDKNFNDVPELMNLLNAIETIRNTIKE